ncbi:MULTISPECIES: EAL domain-containing protein [unclassified Paenibacillus]|uniref:EAL domain-containing protein n=1 Tax=unclassified Paenibacillus TaxID=185978 RepID=UPI001AE9AFAF|nr:MULTISPECIES: EAL domain-containing protein [unclassified Paenibacillus]MBP1153674.1 diguanylate cyclase (GGDEF)-like protein/PAS domain S-box-containing protein [Paenibacillus sp. PvP091]MBP1170941.1 diguanylate cyclase (GGDEF)-like protein/PAS domain S-box-containing protein [Paenibacillus sp. PvR098]MBP2441969.1 diguanylate cyclase (GGDEF)-like protein/PAS domain S-box-containing protein [Paenibacillus sp. PvP052]
MMEQSQIQSMLDINQQQLIHALINELPDLVTIKNGEGRWLHTNPFTLRLFQIEHIPYQGMTNTELASYSPLISISLTAFEDSDKKTWETGTVFRHEHEILQPDGTPKVFDIIKVPLSFPNGERKGLIVIGRDITDLKNAKKRIQHLAYHDDLTGLPNRRHLYEVLTTELLNSSPIAIFFIDLDRFKIINDSLGHLVGDHLLQKVSERLVKCSQKGTVFRHSGDEFVLLLPDSNREECRELAQNINFQLSKPFYIDNHEIYISTSVGICLSNDVDPQTSAQELIKFADLALYQAKQEGKNTYTIYSENIHSRTYSQLVMETDLHRALERNELIIHYQPQIDLESGKLCGMEALIRWNHPLLGFISPSEFIPLAEETGLIIPIGKWVLQTACKQNKELQEQGHPPLVVSVNLSARQFYQLDLVDMVSKVLKETHLEPKYLELEITESMTMDEARSIKILTHLKNLGVKISIDDFGTGYSSLTYLKKFPIDKLKIDQSFVRDCLKEPSDATIVQTIIAMAKNLNLRVIAEGVETKEQLLFLQQHLCHEAQGYFISQPVCLEELEKKFAQLEILMEQYGTPQALNKQRWMEEAVRLARQDLQDTLRLQQGMTYKFKKQDGKFIHTIGDGALLYRIGLSPEELMGKDLFELLPPEKAENKLEFYNKAWAGETLSYEGERNGVFYLAALSPIIRGGRVIEVVASCVDITERKQIEEELKKSEERYRHLVEIAPDAIVVHNNGEILYVNQAAVKLLRGSRAKDILGKSVYDFIQPNGYDITRKRIKLVQEERQDIDPFEKTIIGLDGQFIVVEISGTHVHYNGSAATQIIMRDITKRTHLE